MRIPTIERDHAIRVTRHLAKGIGIASSIGTGFALIAMGPLFYILAALGVIGAWAALYKLERSIFHA